MTRMTECAGAQQFACCIAECGGLRQGCLLFVPFLQTAGDLVGDYAHNAHNVTCEIRKAGILYKITCYTCTY